MKITLLGSISALITPAQRERLERIDAEDLSLVSARIQYLRRTERRPAPSAYLEHGVESLKQYYSLMVLDPLSPHAAGPMITQFWHEHECRGQYTRFCEDVFGQLIDHAKVSHENKEIIRVVRDIYYYTRALLPRVFHHEYIIKEFWAQDLPQEARMTCYQRAHKRIPEELRKDSFFTPRLPYRRGVGFKQSASVRYR